MAVSDHDFELVRQQLEQLKRTNNEQDQTIKSLQQQINQLRLEIGSLRKKVFP